MRYRTVRRLGCGLSVWTGLAFTGPAARADVFDRLPPDAAVVLKVEPPVGQPPPLADVEARWGIPPAAVYGDRDAAAVVLAGPAADDGLPVVLVLPVVDYPAFARRLRPVRTEAGVSVVRPAAGEPGETFVADWGGGYAAVARRPQWLAGRHDGLVLAGPGPGGRPCLVLAVPVGLLAVRGQGPPAIQPVGPPSQAPPADPCWDAVEGLLHVIRPDRPPAWTLDGVGGPPPAAGSSTRPAATTRAAADRDRADLHVLIASRLATDRRFLESAAHLQAAVRRDPTDAAAFHLAGVVLQLLGDPNRSAKMLLEAVRLEPGVAVYHSDAAVPLIQLKRFDAAEAELRRALAIQPDLAPAKQNLTTCRQRAANQLASTRRATTAPPP